MQKLCKYIFFIYDIIYIYNFMLFDPYGCLFKECPMSSDGVNYVTVFTGARMNGAQDLKGR